MEDHKKEIAVIDGKRLLISAMSVMRPLKGDILFVKVADDIHPNHADWIIQNIQDVFAEIGLEKNVAIIVGTDKTNLAVIGEYELSRMGLVKIHKIEETLGSDALEKLGFTKRGTGIYIGDVGIFNGEMEDTTSSEQNDSDVHVVKKYIIYTTENQDAEFLANRYGVNLDECYIYSNLSRNDFDKVQAECYHLYARLDGNFCMPTSKGK